jgi:hypothetical protein
MKQFLIKTWPYILIGLAYFILGEYLLYRLNETKSINEVSKIQSSSTRELYYGRQVLGNSLPLYKYIRLQTEQPDVLVVGQSVSLQFRDFVFEPFEDQFYNAGLMIRNIADLNYLANLFEEGKIKKPRFMLIAVDLSFVLEKTFLDEYSLEFDMPEDRALSIKSHLQGAQKLMLDGHLRARPKLNLGFGKAGMTGRGYRNDGSYRHLPEIEKYLQDSTYYDGDLVERLKEREAPFTVPFNYHPAKAKQLLEILNRFREMNIELLLYIPPYSDHFFASAMKDSMFVAFWQDYMRLQEKLKKENYALIEFTTPSSMGLDDRYMVDSEHPGEVLNAIQLKKYALSYGAESPFLSQLHFKTLDSLLQNEHSLPISFLKDSINADFKLKEENTLAN